MTLLSVCDKRLTMSGTLFSFSRRFQLSSGGNKRKHSVSPILQIAEIAEHVFASLPPKFSKAARAEWRGPYISCLTHPSPPPPPPLWNAELSLSCLNERRRRNPEPPAERAPKTVMKILLRQKEKKSAGKINNAADSKQILPLFLIYFFLFLATSFLRDAFLLINKDAGLITAGGSRSVRGAAAPAH